MGTCVRRRSSARAPAKFHLRRLSAGLMLASLTLPAHAEDVVDTTMTQSRYVLAATLVSSAQYPGSDQREIKLRPLWAYQYGRWRLSSSRASAAQASQNGSRPFAPGAGLRDIHLGTGLTTAITPHWIAFANIGWSRLLGDAGDSPLTRRPNSVGGAVGVAYRN